MSTVEFEEHQLHNFTSRKILGEPQVPGIVNFILKTRIVKNEEKAFKAVFVLIILIFLVAGFLLYITYRNQNLKVIPYDQMTALQKQQIPAKERIYIEKYKTLSQ